MGTCCFGFWNHTQSKITTSRYLIKAKKLPILVLKTKQNNKKQKSYQTKETSHFGFCDLNKEKIFFYNTEVSNLDRREEKI